MCNHQLISRMEGGGEGGLVMRNSTIRVCSADSRHSLPSFPTTQLSSTQSGAADYLPTKRVNKDFTMIKVGKNEYIDFNPRYFNHRMSQQAILTFLFQTHRSILQLFSNLHWQTQDHSVPFSLLLHHDI